MKSKLITAGLTLIVTTMTGCAQTQTTTPDSVETRAGDLKMVTEWWRLSVVKRNPDGDDKPTTLPPPSNPPYISVERTKRTE